MLFDPSDEPGALAVSMALWVAIYVALLLVRR
jgi:hypothetical protein